MPKSKIIYKPVLVAWICFWVLVGCQDPASPVLTQSSESTQIPSSTETTEISSPTPVVHYQITYLAACGDEFQCMYAVETSCLESDRPCLVQPQLLFKIPKTGEGPRYPVLSSSWSPDGQRVVIDAVGLSGQPDIFLGDWSGEKWVNLTNSSEYEGDPSWSPDGRTITYTGKTGEPDNYLRAYSISPDGKNVNRLLHLLDPIFPDTIGISWSPDGRRIVFMHSDNQGYYQLYVANPDGSSLKQLTDRAEDHFDPHFSPDGQWIVFTRQPEKDLMTSNLYLIGPDGTGEKVITQGSVGWRSESRWSPAGNWITFTSDIEGNDDIYLIKPDGTGLTKVTQSDMDVFAPAWRVISP
jgi:Tol biopolymer transport system component